MAAENELSIKCRAKSRQELDEIRATFKKHHVSVAGFLMDCLRRKAEKLREQNDGF